MPRSHRLLALRRNRADDPAVRESMALSTGMICCLCEGEIELNLCAPDRVAPWVEQWENDPDEWTESAPVGVGRVCRDCAVVEDATLSALL